MTSKVRREAKTAESLPDLAPTVPPGLGVALGAAIAALHDALAFDAIAVDLEGEDVPILDGVERIAQPGDLGGMAREKGTAVLVQNAPGTELPTGYNTALALPIESKIASYGSLILYHRRPHRYTAAETDLAALLLRQTVEGIWRQAVGRMRQDELAEQIEQRAVEVAAFDDIMPRISFRDPAETLQSVVDTAADLTGAEFTSIFLREGDRYIAMASHGISVSDLQALAPTPHQGLIARLTRTREPVMVTDYISDVATGYHEGDDFRRFNVRCTLAVPLLQDGTVTGAIYAAKGNPVPFDPGTIRLLERLALFAQIALRNAHHVAYVEEESSRLRGILDTVQESVMVFDRDGRVVAVNDALERELRVRVPIAGVRYDDLARDRDTYFGRGIVPMRPFNETLRQVLETGNPLQGIVELTDPDRTYDARVAPLHVGDEVTGIVVTLRDISPAIEVGRARSRAQVLAQLLQLSAILNSQLSIAALLDHVVEAAVGLVSARAGTLGLLEDNALIFRRWLHDGVWDDIDLSLGRGEGISGVVWDTGKPYISNDSAGDPNAIPDVRARMDIERALVVPLIDRSGHFLGTIHVHNPAGGDNFDEADVEALQLLAHQAAIALENVHLGQLKDEFLSVASHELKTPVTSIKGFTQVLQRRLPEELAGTFGRYLDIVDHQANRLTELINSLLDVSRIQRGRFTFDMETLDYGHLVREVVAELSVVTPHNEITLEAPEEIFVRGNANRLRQVLVNLIDNAVKYGPHGGTVRVVVKPRDGEVATFVCDEGPGLPADERDRIFSPYYQIPHSAGASSGLGLGLFITRQIISEHGGSVWLDDVDHTSFCFTTPASP